MSWRHHPHVRSGTDLTLGERAADRMRNGMGSWGFIFGFIAAMAAWAGVNTWVIGRAMHGHAFDPYPYILLNLLLSTLAGLQGGILLIAAKRADAVASELARHDYQVNMDSLRYHVAVSQLLVEVADQQGIRVTPELRQQLLSPPTVPLPPVGDVDGGVV